MTGGTKKGRHNARNMRRRQKHKALRTEAQASFDKIKELEVQLQLEKEKNAKLQSELKGLPTAHQTQQTPAAVPQPAELKTEEEKSGEEKKFMQGVKKWHKAFGTRLWEWCLWVGEDVVEDVLDRYLSKIIHQIGEQLWTMCWEEVGTRLSTDCS